MSHGLVFFEVLGIPILKRGFALGYSSAVVVEAASDVSGWDVNTFVTDGAVGFA